MAKNAKGQYVSTQVVHYKGEVSRLTGTSRISKAEANRNLEKNVAKWKAEVDGRADVDEKLFSDRLMLWQKTVLAKKGSKRGARSEDTIRTDQDTASALSEAFKGVTVGAMTTERIQTYLTGLLEKVSQSTVRKRYHMLSMYFKYELPGENPMARVTLPVSVTESAEKTAYTDEQIKVLEEELLTPYRPGTCVGYAYGRMLLLILYAFLRIGEATEIRWKDLAELGWLHVQRQYNDRSKKVQKPKYHEVRHIPLASHVTSYVAEPGDPEGLVFSMPDGGHVPENTLRKELKRACLRAGVPVHTVHDLRHDGISYWVRHLPLTCAPDLSRWAGHKDLTTTLRRYYRMADDYHSANASYIYKEEGQ